MVDLSHGPGQPGRSANYTTMLKTHLLLLLISASVLLGCNGKGANESQAIESLSQPKWDREVGSIKIRYSNEPGETLEAWWLEHGQTATTIEIEAPPSKFQIESDEGMLGETIVGLPGEKINYKITVVSDMADENLHVQFRIHATEISSALRRGSLSQRHEVSVAFGSSGYLSPKGFPAFENRNPLDDENIYLWIAKPISADPDKQVGDPDKQVSLKIVLPD